MPTTLSPAAAGSRPCQVCGTKVSCLVVPQSLLPQPLYAPSTHCSPNITFMTLGTGRAPQKEAGTLFFWLWGHTQQCSGSTPGGTRGILWDTRDQAQVGCLRGKLCPLSYHSDPSLFKIFFSSFCFGESICAQKRFLEGSRFKSRGSGRNRGLSRLSCYQS